MDQIEVIHGDTALVATGVGTMGSRSAILGGTALLKASVDVRENDQDRRESYGGLAR